MKREEHAEEFFRGRTWYGLEAVIEVRSGFWHKAGFGTFLIPHPPLVNGLLRKGLSRRENETLSCIHEFGHLQTLPLYLIYTVILVSILINNGHNSIIELVLALISTHAFWEIISESYTMFHSGRLYHSYYRNIAVLPRLLFWLIVTFFTIGGWTIFMVDAGRIP